MRRNLFHLACCALLISSPACFAESHKIEVRADRGVEQQFSSTPLTEVLAGEDSLVFFTANVQDEEAGGAAPEAPVSGVNSADEIAAALANPIANLISVPFQFNFDFGAGPTGDGSRMTLNIQPVIPISISDNWNLITRTIIPVIAQDSDFSSFSPDGEFGLGDTVFSGFFSPKEPVKLTDTANLTWGVGPAIYLPTATDSALGADQFGLGPTAVALIIDGPLTYGALVNHIWGIGKTEDFDNFIVDRPDINATFLQPFFTYGLGEGWSVTAAAEASYNWESDQWTIPVGVFLSKVITIGGQTISLQAGPRYYAEGPNNAPDWGFRLNATLVFPF